MDEHLARLRAADPVRGGGLDGLDPASLHALRDHIAGRPSAGRSSSTPVRRRRRARRAAVGGLAVALLGGGVAYASYASLVGWYSGGAGDGLTCVSAWGTDLQAVHADSSGGPVLSGDPVADCQHYQQLTGREPIDDPVAFRFAPLGVEGGSIYVGPRDEVPDDAEVITPSPDAAAVRELEASTRDWVDGMRAHCFDETGGRAFVTAELDRLGLTGWTIDVAAPDAYAHGSCAGVATVDASTRSIDLRPDWSAPPGTVAEPGDTSPEAFEIRDGLRALAEQCLPLDEASAGVERVLGAEHHWPTTTVVDPDAACTRVDMEVGGSIQVTLRGPEAPTPRR